MQYIGPRMRQSTNTGNEPVRQNAIPTPEPAIIPQRDDPVLAAAALGEAVRAEHGREGIRRYLLALAPLLPGSLLEQAATRLGVDMPVSPAYEAHREPPPPQKKASIPPEQLLKLFQSMNKPDGGGSGGLDPSVLLKLMRG